MAEADPQANIAQYKLSNQQNALVQVHQSRIAKAAAAIEEAQKDADQARLIYEAKAQTLQARQAAHRSEIENRDNFFNYVIGEFELPAPKDGCAWSPREIEPGKFALFAEVDGPVPVESPAPSTSKPRTPTHRFKNRNKPAAVAVMESPEQDTNNDKAGQLPE